MNYYLDVLKKYATFEGRARRSEYWMFVLINGLINVAFKILYIFIPPIVFLSLLYSLAVLIPSIAVTTRRLHDVEKSGWWQLLALLPILGWIPLLIWTCTDSTPGDNLYGSNPKTVEFTDSASENY